MEKTELNITGMDCADCALTLEKGVSGLDGVNEVQVNFSVAKMTLLGDVDVSAVQDYIETMGYGVSEKGARPVILSGRLLFLDLVKRPRNMLTLIGLCFVVLAFIGSAIKLPEIVNVIFFAVGGIAGLYYPAR